MCPAFSRASPCAGVLGCCATVMPLASFNLAVSAVWFDVLMSSAQPELRINWQLAASTATKLAPAGPKLDAAEIRAAVANIRAHAERSVDLVHELTKLDAAKDLRDSDLLVVDRAGWAKANSQAFDVVLAPALEALNDKARQSAEGVSQTASRVGTNIAGAQIGAILALLSTKVLGQYEPFADRAGMNGRLLLVAPNIVEIERELKVNPDDFRLWVCLHEQTHRVQFAAAPWLKAHMIENISVLSRGLAENASTFAQRLSSGAKQAKSALEAATGRDEAPSESGGALNLFASEEDKARISHLTAVMSLLEGHATVIMDSVDASVIPTVKTIRQRFNDRGRSRSSVEKFIRKLLGLDAKAQQYVAGAKFVRGVVEASSLESFNRIWERPENLPTETEIAEPKLWLERMDQASR